MVSVTFNKRPAGVYSRSDVLENNGLKPQARKTIDSLGYISAAESIGLSSTTFT